MRALVWLAVVAAVGCGESKSGEQPRSAPKPQAQAEPETYDVAEHMKDHFARVAAIKEALILNKVDEAHGPATWLAEHTAPEHMPAGWLPHVADFQLVASELAEETDLRRATAAAAELARACGACHAALHAKPTFQVPPVPAAEGDHKVYMQRHKWAADRLWEGLVTPSADAWNTGAATLADSPVHFADLSSYGDRAPKIVELGKHVHELAGRAAAAAEPEAQAAVMGEFLATCATCHTLVGRTDAAKPTEPAEPALAK